MILAGELAGAFLAGVGFTLIMLAVFAGRLSKWAMRRMMKNAFTPPIYLGPAQEKDPTLT